jgi:hypothetical protein
MLTQIALFLKTLPSFFVRLVVLHLSY